MSIEDSVPTKASPTRRRRAKRNPATTPCIYFATAGGCARGAKCSFVHDRGGAARAGFLGEPAEAAGTPCRDDADADAGDVGVGPLTGGGVGPLTGGGVGPLTGGGVGPLTGGGHQPEHTQSGASGGGDTGDMVDDDLESLASRFDSMRIPKTLTFGRRRGSSRLG
jgi:hypothetical protein